MIDLTKPITVPILSGTQRVASSVTLPMPSGASARKKGALFVTSSAAGSLKRMTTAKPIA